MPSMNIPPHSTSRFLLIPQVAEASTMANAPVLRRYSLARLASSLSPARPVQRSAPVQPPR